MLAMLDSLVKRLLRFECRICAQTKELIGANKQPILVRCNLCLGSIRGVTKMSYICYDVMNVLCPQAQIGWGFPAPQA